MATTANYGWTKPDVQGSDGAWGTIVNAALDAIDAALKTVSDLATAALPKAGGTLTGRLDAKTATFAFHDMGLTTGAAELDLAVAQAFALSIGTATALSFANVPAAGTLVAVLLRITNGPTGVTWPANTKWSGGQAPLFTVGGTDLVGLLTDDGGATWRGVLISADSR